MDESKLSGQVLFSADLTKGSSGFTFRDDIFGCGTKGVAEGRWEPPSDKLGGTLWTIIQPSEGMESKPVSGGWSLPVKLSEPGLMSINIRYWVSTRGMFEPNQSVDALLTVDGHPVGCNSHGSLVRVHPSTIYYNDPLGTGWREATFDMYLLAGSHTVRFGLRAPEGLAPGTWSRMMVDRMEIRKAASVTFTGDGGFVIHAGDRDFASGSLFSRPGGGWYRIGADASPQGDAVRWQIKPGNQTGNKWEGTAETPQFSLHRAIHVDGHRVRVEDTLTNLSDKDLGWMIRNELAVPVDPASAPAVHLGGDSRLDPSTIYTRILKDGARVTGIDCWRPSNPTVFVPFPDAGIGLLIEDDVTRVHSFTYWRLSAPDSMTVGLRDENFALPPGGKYTIRWSAYIIPGVEKTYYDFINQVRADRGLNDIRIPGPTVWSTFINAMQTMTDEDIQSRLRKSGAWAVATSLNGWIDPESLKNRTDPTKHLQIGFGPGVLDPYFAPLRESWAKDGERIHRLAPDVKVIHYFHTFLYDPPRDPDSFKDSWVTRRDGTPAINDWGGLLLTPSMQVYPTRTNGVGRGMLKVLDEMTGPMKGNGIYFDEVNYPTGIGWMDFFPYTFNSWDGHSAILDPETFAVVQKCGYLELLSGDFKKMLFDKLVRKGWVVLGNGEPDTWWEDNLKFPRHTECRTDPYPRAYESHLYSPIALVEDRSFKHTREMLRYGVIDCFVRLEDPDLARQEHIIKSFPITVQEIHSGWLKGSERIITMVSGKYSWNESARVRIYEFNADGVLFATRDGYVSTDGTFNITVPEDGLVIIERTASE
ncbi:MAG: hypothetical protein ACYC27_06460 [Armatimonadota bacterium]